MTCIAWDGKELAADRRMVSDSLIGERTKIHKSPCGTFMYGTTGSSDIGAEVIAWYLAGANPQEFPQAQRSKDDWAGLVVIHKDGRIHKYERGPYPITIPSQRYALGCGRDFAMAAMHLGKTAREAVEVACALDAFCGNGVDVLTFE